MYIIYLYNILIKNIYSNKNPTEQFDDCIYITLFYLLFHLAAAVENRGSIFL